MSNAYEVDLSPYMSPMRFGAQHGIVLTAQLDVAAPDDLTPREKAALAKAKAQSIVVGTIIKGRVRTSIGGLRPVLADVDNAYGALHGRLAAAATMPAGLSGGMTERAQAILEAVLIDGLSFLVNDAERKYAESQRILETIDERGLTREINAVAGAGFLDAVKAAHAELGEAIGVGETPVRYARAELRAARSVLAQTIADYCVQLASQVDRDDPESVRRFRDAVMPIDRFRADRVGREETDEDEDEVVTPTPVVTPVTDAAE